MIDHIGINVIDFDRSRTFYDAALAPLQIAIVMEVSAEESGGAASAGYGKRADSGDIQAGKPTFWIAQELPLGNQLHVAFVADDREQVDAFWNAAVMAGGKDHGPPGLREHYHPNYYAAFVLDPDGHNIEAVCHKPG
jgi:catechol 2,3-dioxygenase-like lactoylglutathione lyase family enzyme